VGGKKHVLGAAKSDTFGAETPRGLRVTWNVRVGAHTECAAESIRPAHEFGKHAGVRIGVDSLGLALEDLTGRSVERQPVTSLHRNLLATHFDAELAFVFVDFESSGAGDARRSHSAGNYCGMARHAATRSENSLRNFHSMDIIGLRLGADQD